MLNIDEKELRQLLVEDRKSYIETSQSDGIGEAISGFSLIISYWLGDFSKISPILGASAWIFAIAILLYGIYKFYKVKRRFYSAKNLYEEICELDDSYEHPFNILLLKSNKKDGRYLLYHNKRWRTYHFPNYKASTTPYDEKTEKGNALKSFMDSFDISDKEQITISKIGDIYDRKYSVGDKTYKKFHFYFYQVETNHQFPNHWWISSFSYNGKKYVWYTLDKMYKKRSIKRTNERVLDFVRNNLEPS